MDYALVNLIVTIATGVVLFLYRKRILSYIGALFAANAIEWAKAQFLTQEISEAADGTKVAKTGLSAQAKGLLAASVPTLVQEALKSIKLKPGTVQGLPPDIDLSSMASALPTILPMLPKRYQGFAALAAPFLSNFLGNSGPKSKPPEGKVDNPFAKDLVQ